jgi:site-specific DNA-methyltransferase (cytosine-N4-specific)
MADGRTLSQVNCPDRFDNRRERAWELYLTKMTKAAIAKELGVSAMTIGRWIAETELEGEVYKKPGKRPPRLNNDQLRRLNDILRCQAIQSEAEPRSLDNEQIVEIIKNEFGVHYHPKYIHRVLARVRDVLLQDSGTIYFQSPQITLYCGDAIRVLNLLPRASVDCIITSPPYYGQRDYGVPDQIGLEKHPQEYIERLVAVFRVARHVLKPTGSLWVNLGDTYWSGKGQSGGVDFKQKNRRFLRPQDRSGPRPLCTPKQLLLIPHRFAIAMQEEGWIVRNDNVWYKVNPTPDPVKDRSAAAHEYMFHFVLGRHYYYNFDTVAVPSGGECSTKPLPSVWQIPIAPNFKKHIAVFPEALVRAPILATLPPDGILLDPFCGSGTALGCAIAQGEGRRAIGIDISISALGEAKDLLSREEKTPAL